MAKVERSNENGSDKPVAIETSYLRGWLWLKKKGFARNSGTSFVWRAAPRGGLNFH